MRLRLFGKILLAFWLTLLLLTVGLWFLYAAQRDAPSRLGSAVLPLLANRLETTGPEAARRSVQLLPRHMHNNITIEPAPAGNPAPVGDRFHVAQRAIAPDGRPYELVYHAPGRRGPLDVPSPIVIAAAAAGFLFSVGLTVYLTRPLMMLREGFGRVAQGDLQVRLSGRVGPRSDEISDLARDFDRMTARLQQLLEARDRLLHDVSHELRSPLTRLQLAIGLARQDPRRIEVSLERIEREALKLEAMVQELLALARAESGVVEHSTEYFDPVAVTEAVVSDAQFEAQDDRRVVLTLPPLDESRRPSVRGSAELIQRAIENVVRNALRFSPAGGTVQVAVELVRSPLGYRCEIIDEGRGVDPLLLGRLFEPFVRADRAGVGLGLAIAKRAIIAHGGEVSARNRPEGGFAVQIVLPAVAHDPSA